MTLPLKEAESILKKKLLAYHKECQRKAEEEAKKKQQEMDKTSEKLGLAKVEVKPNIPSNQTKGAIGTAYITKRWTFTVENKEKVPEEYKILDTTKINNAIRAGIREIPGLRIYQEERIGAR